MSHLGGLDFGKVNNEGREIVGRSDKIAALHMRHGLLLLIRAVHRHRERGWAHIVCRSAM